ncbi:predicted protein [Scheffersomyces stipitis CBS 6054]|uniref:Micro-fibrillar-associated protein 1 C-terminal domain-containing protein n=1 Tax=Scheffersomyces stipitis (strain ATCC 58785 / CBS 6054 / NBRC 10063 / NRRL Y-11545) TaxID=322104 RepID=A3GI08_PICST|nr:predicted protein [Scheffersomyces stipitis CBS 6054]EAZ63148.2 predicted protein [Scheffersomyces stipitis CBS 6054]
MANSSSSGSESSDSGSYESSSEDELILQPVFLTKSQRSKKTESEDNENRSKQALLSKIDNNISNSINDLTVDSETLYDGIDDTDDLDPEKEYSDWKERELARFNRDRLAWQLEEQEQDEKIRRQQLTEEELQQRFEDKKLQHKETTGISAAVSNVTVGTAGTSKIYHKGAFYHDDEDIDKLLKRDYAQVDEDNKKDHSRPTKLKFKKTHSN